MDYSKQFKYILEIAKCQSISLAAEHLDLQQPYLSKYLKKVENELGAELFDRSSTPIKLTEAGKCYIETAHKIIDTGNQLQKQIFELKNKSDCIKIGVGPSRAPYIMPTIISEFFKIAPNIKLSIFEGSTIELSSKLQSGELDVIISVIDSTVNDFVSVELFDETILLAAPKNAVGLSFDDIIEKHKIIAPAKGQLLSQIIQAIPNAVSDIECQNIVTALSLVSIGVGATLVPSYISQSLSNVDNIYLIPLPESIHFGAKRKVCIFYRKEQFLSKFEKLFIKTAVKATENK